MEIPSEEVIKKISELSSSRERYVLEMRLGIDCERAHTLQEIADKLEITRERVRQIQHSALLKLASSELNSVLLISDLTAPSRRGRSREGKRSRKHSNALLRSGEKMNLPDQFIVVQFSIPVTESTQQMALNSSQTDTKSGLTGLGKMVVRLPSCSRVKLNAVGPRTLLLRSRGLPELTFQLHQ